MIMEEPLLIYKKKELRKKMLALRRALSTDETDKMAMCLRANIVSLPQYKKANRIMAFLAMSCLLYTSPSPRDGATSRMPSSA